jgi:hypothetical protein
MKGEGRPGSGMMFHTHAPRPTRDCKIIHPLALDSYADITGWHAQCHSEGATAEITGRQEQWCLKIEDGGDQKRIALEGSETLAIQPTAQADTWHIL